MWHGEDRGIPPSPFHAGTSNTREERECHTKSDVGRRWKATASERFFTQEIAAENKMTDICKGKEKT